jgi:4-hydroxy-3-polyprenylbenzoate decarboxylase
MDLVISPEGERVIIHETGRTPRDLQAFAARSYDCHDFSAPIASGSFRVDAMVIVPCSMKTLSAVVYSYAENLMVRSADVMLKERRTLILVPRESPLHWGHLNMMCRAAELGAIICPPVPAYYSHPQSLSDIVDGSVGRILDLLEVENTLAPRWEKESLTV